MTQEEYDDLLEKIRQVYSTNNLEKVIGDALGKNAVMVILIDVIGRVLVIGKHAKDADTSVRDYSMLRQMAELLNDNMVPMMQKAGKEFRGES